MNIKKIIIIFVCFSISPSLIQAKGINDTRESHFMYSEVKINKMIVGHYSIPYFCVEAVKTDFSKIFCVSSASGASRDTFDYLFNFSSMANLSKSKIRVYYKNTTLPELTDKYPDHFILSAISNCNGSECL